MRAAKGRPYYVSNGKDFLECTSFPGASFRDVEGAVPYDEK